MATRVMKNPISRGLLIDGRIAIDRKGESLATGHTLPFSDLRSGVRILTASLEDKLIPSRLDLGGSQCQPAISAKYTDKGDQDGCNRHNELLSIR